MKSEPGKPIAVSAGLVFRAGKLLITQRPAGGVLGGLWEFPGGKCEPGEAFEACLHRELMEELGIEVEILALFEDLTHAYPERTVQIRFFRCRWLRHEPKPILCSDLAWITTEQLADYPFPAADERVLEKLRNSPEIW